MCSWGCKLIKRKVKLISVCYQIWVEVTRPKFSTRFCVEVKSDGLPLLLVTWIDLVTSSTVLVQSFSACSEIMIDQNFWNNISKPYHKKSSELDLEKLVCFEE